MSWAEVYKINSNIVKPLNEQIRDYNLMPMWFFTATTEWTPPKTGLYRIICVGAGGSGRGGSNHRGGGAGGVVMGIHKLSSAVTYNLTVSTTASFDTLQTATAGSSAGTSSVGKGGGGAGGTVYQGEDGGGSGGVVPSSGTRLGGNVTFFVMGSRAISSDVAGGGYGAGGGAVYTSSSNRTYFGGIGFFNDGNTCNAENGTGGDACILV